MISEIKDILSIIISFATIITLSYTLYKFSRKPHDTLEERHDALEKRVDEHDVILKRHEESMHLGNDRFREQEDTNEVLIRSVFALLEFEVHYCETEQKPISKNLERAKDDLHDYLASK